MGATRASASIAAGKQADLVVIDGDPSKTIADVRKVETVFKQGVGFDPAKLIASVSWKGRALVIGALLLSLVLQAPVLPRATEGDFVIKDFKFASGETLPELKIHYRTLGTPQKNAQGVVTQRRADHARHRRHGRAVRRTRLRRRALRCRGSRSTSRSISS